MSGEISKQARIVAAASQRNDQATSRPGHILYEMRLETFDKDNTIIYVPSTKSKDDFHGIPDVLS